MITKAAGNPYNEKEAEGFKEVIEANGGTAIIQHPEAPTADAQVSVIQSLISQDVDASVWRPMIPMRCRQPGGGYGSRHQGKRP